MPDDVAPVETARRLVTARLRGTIADLDRRLAHVGAEGADLTDGAARLLSGGKRLRAAFCVAGWESAGGPPPADTDAPVIAAGASLELFQAAALVHDDVMDGSRTRRGQPAAHEGYASAHRSRGWQGSPDRFGEAAAILLGDLLLVASSGEMAAAASALPPAAARRARGVYDLMTAEVTLGQYLDIYAQAVPWDQDFEIERDRAERVVRAKSARYSVEHPVVLGAALAGGDERLLAALAAFGLPIGEAFQLRDDVLGVFGDPAVTGKPAGDDLREGKRTLLVALAVERARGRDRATLLEGIGNPALDAPGIARIRQILVETGAVAAVEEQIEERTRRGFGALESAAVPAPARAALTALATLAVRRES
jgi:geranylgeranyl diphosphate synthase type I